MSPTKAFIATRENSPSDVETNLDFQTLGVQSKNESQEFLLWVLIYYQTQRCCALSVSDIKNSVCTNKNKDTQNNQTRLCAGLIPCMVTALTCLRPQPLMDKLWTLCFISAFKTVCRQKRWGLTDVRGRKTTITEIIFSAAESHKLSLIPGTEDRTDPPLSL